MRRTRLPDMWDIGGRPTPEERGQGLIIIYPKWVKQQALHIRTAHELMGEETGFDAWRRELGAKKTVDEADDFLSLSSMDVSLTRRIWEDAKAWLSAQESDPK